MRRARPVPLLSLLLATAAAADGGALTVDAGGGGVATILPAPSLEGYSPSARTTFTTAAAAAVGARYALTNSLELAAAGFYEPAVSVFHNQVTLAASDGTQFPGTLAHRYLRFGAAAGARFLWGSEQRLTLGAEVGWTRRLYTGFQQINDGVTPAVDYRLGLRDITIDNVTVAVVFGVEWAFTDKMSVSLLPRLQLLSGRQPAIAVLVPLTVSYSWYL